MDFQIMKQNFAYNMYQKEVLNTQDLLQKLDSKTSMGHQISRRLGILNITKCIYTIDDVIYLFDISEDFIFSNETGLSRIDFKREYKDALWIYEYPIS